MTAGGEAGRRGRRVVLGMTAVYLAFVAWLTLGPQPTNPDSRGFFDGVVALVNSVVPEIHFDYSNLEFLGNIALFVPIGILFVVLLGPRRWWIALLIGVAMTLAIEGAQEFIPSRVSDVRDLVANSTGTAIGVVAALVGIRARRRTRR